MTTLKIGTPKEIYEGEARVAMTPESALQLQKLGYDCAIESGAGMLAGFSDKAYAEAGVEIKKTAAALWKDADIIAKVREPDESELKRLKSDHTLISFFNPAGNEKGMQAAAKRGTSVIAMEMVPRISRAQKMDPDKMKITFKDVAGVEEAKSDLAETIEFLKDPTNQKGNHYITCYP